MKEFLKFNWLSTKFFIRLFLLQIAIIVLLKICGVKHMSDAFVIGSMGFIVGLLTVYTAEKIKKNGGPQ